MDNNYNFQKLTPIRDVELKIYANALDKVFSDDDLKNIAITGPYSSGKSSMLETYKDKRPDKKFIHISLAHFETATNADNDLSQNNDESEETETSNKRHKTEIIHDVAIEGKILNQLIHQINPENIPQSHFKIKKNFPKKEAKRVTAITTIFIALLLFIFNRGIWSDFVHNATPWLKYTLIVTTTGLFKVMAVIACMVIFFFALYFLWKLQHNKNILKKISIQGNEIEIFGKTEDSFFNKHLNEVLYLFRNTQASAIVFEDMDRYNSNHIFEKLREINYLLNNGVDNDNKKVKKVYRFFYLLRDDIFTTKDRTKFFDFIIPIVPVIDGANSYDQFIKHFENGGILENFAPDFLQDISLYVDDMRILKNIYNEYIIYYNRIQSTGLNCNKLLAMIIYKNLFPRDFSELQIGKGFVWCLFDNKQFFIMTEIKKLESQIKKVENLLSAAKQEKLNDIDELDALYFKEDGLYVSSSSKRVAHFSTRAEFIREMKQKPDEVYRSNGYNNSYINIKPILDNLLNIQEYVDRKNIIEAKSEDTQNMLRSEILNYKKKIEQISSYNLCEIIQFNKESINKIFGITHTDEIGEIYSYNDVKSNHYFPLIKYLVRNGHIDENYPDYMSYFYEKSMTRTDKTFLRKITDEEAQPFSYNLNNAALVASKISPRYYSKPEVLNFDLFEYLLETPNKHLDTIFEQLRNNFKSDFIIEFWNTNRSSALFFKYINRSWASIWKEFCAKNVFTDLSKNQYLIDTFYYSSLDELKNMNIDECITKHISSCTTFLAVPEPNIPVIMKALGFLGIKFNMIEYESANMDLFIETYNKNLYEINKNMIFLILRHVYQIPETADYKHRNYSLLNSKPHEPLAIYIRKDENINDYIELVLNICEKKIEDDEKVVKLILDNPKIEMENKETYLQYLKTNISELKSISDKTLWSLILSLKLSPCTKNNIFEYYYNSGNGFDDILTDFINNSKPESGLSYKEVIGLYDEKKALAFYKDLIKNNNLSDEKYSVLISSFGTSYPKFTFEDIDDTKMIILIKSNIIAMNIDNLLFIREKYPKVKMQFIKAGIDVYVDKVINAETFVLDELVELLPDKIQDKYILKLLEFTGAPISIKNIILSDNVKKHILEKNYFKDDLTYFISKYDSENSAIQDIILNRFINQIDEIKSLNIKIPYDFFIKILQSSDIDFSDKYLLFISQLELINKEQVKECLRILEMKELLTIFESKQPIIKLPEKLPQSNVKFLEILKKKEWISSYTAIENKPGFYRVRGKKSIIKRILGDNF